MINLTVYITDTLPSDVTFMNASVTPNSTAGNVISWDNVSSNLVPGDSYSLTYNVTSNVTGSYTNLVNVTGVPLTGYNVSDTDSLSFSFTDPPVSSSSSPSSSDSTKSFTLSKDFDCTTGILRLETGGVSGVQVKLLETSPTYQLLSTKSTDSDGVEFTITESGTYKITAIKSGYNLEQFYDVELTMCNEPVIPTAECTVDSECSSTRACVDGTCAEIIGSCGFVDNHEWVAYECCLDSDCVDGQVCNVDSNTCGFLSSDLEEQALAALENANGIIAIARSEGKDVSAAELMYADAQKLFDLKEYIGAKLKAEQSISLIKEKAKPITTVPANTTSTQTPKPEPKKADPLGILFMLGAGIVLLVVLVGAYFIIKRRNHKKNKGYKQ
jgi:hypothetical protein